LSTGDCLEPHDFLRETLIDQFSKTSSFDWKAISARFPQYEEEIARQEIINDHVAKKQRDYIRSAEKVFAKLLDDYRPDFDRLYQNGDATRPATLCEFLGRSQIEGGSFWSPGIGFYARVIKDRPDEQTIREFVGKCPPFRAFLLAICVAQYERCVRDLKAGRSLRAGKFDLYMSLYLPYCDEFITADEGQLNALQEVVSVGNLGVRVRSYEDLRDGLFGRPSVGA
jgi:hypothetical protein